MIHLFNNPLPKPFSEKIITQILLVLVVVLAMVAGYYHNLAEIQQRKYRRLELKYQDTLEILSESLKK